MRSLLIKASLILAVSELAVMGVLSHAELWRQPYSLLLDPVLMLLFALGPLYLLFKGERAKLDKQNALDSKLHVIVNDLWSASLHTLSADKLFDRILNEILDNSPITLQRKGAIFLVEDGELRLKSSTGFSDEHTRLCGTVPPGRCLCGTVLQTGEPVYAGEVEERHHIRPPGITPHGHYCMPIKSGGQVIGVLNLYLDQGHRRDAAEEKFLASVCAITARIIEGKKLESSLFQMQKMQALNRFAAGISHDFNNILGVIGAYCSTAAKALPPGSSAGGDISEICVAVERGARLTNQLHLFSRQASAEEQAIDINPLIDNSADIIRRLAGGAVKVELKTAGSPLMVKCSRSQLEQVLLNLAVNARDAMPGGGTLSVSASRQAICFPSTRQCLDAALITMADTGEEMTQEVREKIFEPFFTTKPEGKGSGLGLAIVHGIVRQHGGEIVVRSAPGSGTRFDIYLPLHQPSTPE